MTVVDWPDP